MHRPQGGGVGVGGPTGVPGAPDAARPLGRCPYIPFPWSFFTTMPLKPFSPTRRIETPGFSWGYFARGRLGAGEGRHGRFLCERNATVNPKRKRFLTRVVLMVVGVEVCRNLSKERFHCLAVS